MDYAINIPRTDLLVKKRELENTIKESSALLEHIDAVLKLFPPEKRTQELFQAPERTHTNYEIVEQILKEAGQPIQLKEVYFAYLSRGGKTKRASFDVSIGKWLRHPNK